MKIEKQELMDILKKNALSEDFAEQVLEQLGKGLGNSLIDIVKLAAEKSENVYDDMVVASIEGKARELVNDLEIEL